VRDRLEHRHFYPQGGQGGGGGGEASGGEECGRGETIRLPRSPDPQLVQIASVQRRRCGEVGTTHIVPLERLLNASLIASVGWCSQGWEARVIEAMGRRFPVTRDSVNATTFDQDFATAMREVRTDGLLSHLAAN
jgi:hypothetical protein